MKTKSLITGAVTVAIGVATLAMPGAAHAAAPDDAGPRLERACLRIPNLEQRTVNLIERLEGDAATVGSLQWLQRQIERATATDRAQLADVLSNRLAVRTATLDLMRQRLDQFPELRQFCADHGVVL